MNLHYISRDPLRGSREMAPTLVLLHGVRSNEKDLMGLAPLLDDRFRIMSIRAPLMLGPDAWGWYNVEFRPEGYVLDEDEAKNGLNILLGFLDEMPQPLYLMGFSQGAIMSVAAALSVPEKVAGVVACSGRLLDSLLAGIAEPERLRGLPVMALHGIRDTVIPVEAGRAIRDRLVPLGVDLTWREYDMGHHLTQESIEDVRVWLSERLASTDWRSEPA